MYLDCDVFIFNEIKLDNYNTDNNIIYASHDISRLSEHFCLNWDLNKKKLVFEQLYVKYNSLFKNAFNTGVMYFNSDIINDNTVNKLFELKKEYKIINNHRYQSDGTDQPIINLLFHNKFKKLGDEFLIGGKLTKNTILVHLFSWYAPWKNIDINFNNLTIKENYLNNLNKFNII